MRHLLSVAALACCAAVVAPVAYAPGSPPALPAPDGAQDFVYLGEARPILVRMFVEVNGRPLQAVWDEFVTGLFKDADANGDGVLSREEAGRLLPPQALLGGGAPYQVRVVGAPGDENQVPFAALDASKDGKVTRDELARYYRANGFAPFQFRGGNGNRMVARRFVRVLGQAEPMTPEAINKVLFDLLDTNKDGKLSLEELAAGPARLAKLDLNDDEMIDVNELNPNAIPDDGLAGTAVAFVAEEMLSNNDDFVAVAPGEVSKDLARRLLAKYGPMSKGPGPQKLTREALGLDEATFATLDVDGDGALDAEELARFAGRPADLKLMARLGKTPAVELLPERGRAAALADKVRTDRGGTLRLDLGATQIELAVGGGGPMNARFDLRSQYRAEFNRADRDNNGYLDRDEANRSPLFRNLFKAIDRDGDGKIFEKEVIAYLDKTERLQESATESCVSLAVAPVGNGLFDLLDLNRDRRLSVRELRQMTRLIEQLDRDGDGCVGRDEIPRTFRLTVQQGPAGDSGFAGNVVVAPRRVMMGGAPPPEPAAGPVWFRKMDRNRDGDVSRREFLGTDEEFRRIDTNGDGLISAAEAARADDLLRKAKKRKP
jgi:Ca2+-binding EF-hand superfamily protein